MERREISVCSKIVGHMCMYIDPVVLDFHPWSSWMIVTSIDFAVLAK